MKALLLVPALTLAACGSTRAIEPPAGKPLVPAAYGAPAPETTGELLTPSVQARPGRGDSLMQRSQERQSDAFDLPPR